MQSSKFEKWGEWRRPFTNQLNKIEFSKFPEIPCGIFGLPDSREFPPNVNSGWPCRKAKKHRPDPTGSSRNSRRNRGLSGVDNRRHRADYIATVRLTCCTFRCPVGHRSVMKLTFVHVSSTLHWACMYIYQRTRLQESVGFVSYSACQPACFYYTSQSRLCCYNLRVIRRRVKYARLWDGTSWMTIDVAASRFTPAWHVQFRTTWKLQCTRNAATLE